MNSQKTVKKNFTFLISSVIFVVALVLFVRNDSDIEELFISPTYEYPALYYSRSAQGAVWAAVLYDEPSLYGRVVVLDDTRALSRYLLLDGVINNSWTVGGPPSKHFENIAILMERHSPDARDVAMVGLGAGMLLKAWDGSGYRVDVAEINPRVVDVVERFFGIPQNLEYGIFTDDGRHFIQTSEKSYDVIVVDLCDIFEANAHLFTTQFFELAKTKLTNQGLFVTTLNVLTTEDGLELPRRVGDTLASQFGYIYTLGADIRGSGREGGGLDFVTFIASDRSIDAATRDEFSLQVWHQREGSKPFRDSDTAFLVRAHEPILEELRQTGRESFGEKLFLER